MILICLLFGLITGKPNLFIGTGGFAFGCGSNSPAVQRPFSFIRLGPDTSPLAKKLNFPFQHFGGYSDNDHSIRAFSHMHLVGAGVQDLGVYGVLPQIVPKSSSHPKIPSPNLTTKFFKTT